MGRAYHSSIKKKTYYKIKTRRKDMHLLMRP